MDQSTGNEIASDDNIHNVLLNGGSFGIGSLDSRDLELARRLDLTRETSFGGLATGTGVAVSSMYAAQSTSSRSATLNASIAAVDEAFASPDSLLDDDLHESLWSPTMTSLKGRRLR